MTKRFTFCLILSALLVISCSTGGVLPTASSAPKNDALETDPIPSTTAVASLATPRGQLQNVPYCNVNGVDLLMDVYFPANVTQPSPATIYVHGGGWVKGDKSGGLVDVIAPALTRQGFTVFAINYRLAPDSLFPAMIEDVKCAIRSIRAHATEYNIDPDHIGLWGASAGGHLVSLAGVADESAGFDTGEYLQFSSQVQAVVDMFGPSDLTLLSGNLLDEVFGDYDLIAASPVTYISANDPPFLILHGEDDELVPPYQSYLLSQHLTTAGVANRLIIVQNAGHGFQPTNGQIDPSMPQIVDGIVEFFQTTLQ